MVTPDGKVNVIRLVDQDDTRNYSRNRVCEETGGRTREKGMSVGTNDGSVDSAGEIGTVIRIGGLSTNT